MEDTGQYFPVMLFIILYKVILTFEFLDESYRAVPSRGTVYSAVQSGSDF